MTGNVATHDDVVAAITASLDGIKSQIADAFSAERQVTDEAIETLTRAVSELDRDVSRRLADLDEARLFKGILGSWLRGNVRELQRLADTVNHRKSEPISGHSLDDLPDVVRKALG